MSRRAAWRVALGCGSFFGVGSSLRLRGEGIPHDAAFAIMDAAWEAGLQWFDTADAYGGGVSEAWIGEWMRARGVRPRLTTKTFHPMDPGDPGGLDPERIRRQIPTSLERLGVDRVDLFLFHAYDARVPVDESLDAVSHAVEVGLSNVTASQVAPVAGRIQWIQNSFSMLDHADDRDLIPLCRTHGIGYQAWSPLAGGWLAGGYERGKRYGPKSRAALLPAMYSSFDRAEVWDTLDRLRADAAQRQQEMATLAMAWAIARVDSIVIGPKRPEHVRQALDALTLTT